MIVASGNIYEDRTAAIAAAEAGAQSHRRDSLDRPVAARFRAVRPDDRGLRRHVRDAGELRHHARGARRDLARSSAATSCSRTMRAACACRRSRDGGARTARHAAQRLDVRHSVPRHQHEADVRRPALQPHAQRAIPGSSSTPARTTTSPRPTPSIKRRRCWRRSSSTRSSRIAPGCPTANRTRRRVRDQPGPRGRLPLRGRAGAAGASDLPRRPAEVHAADQAHDRRHLQGPSDRRDVQSHVGDDEPDDPPLRHADRGDPHAVPRRPRARARERALRDEHGPSLRRRDRLASRRDDRAPRAGGAYAAARRCSSASPRWA